MTYIEVLKLWEEFKASHHWMQYYTWPEFLRERKKMSANTAFGTMAGQGPAEPIDLSVR